jgi:drug/metabolite transporter (DMT)-like permease
MDSSTLPQDKLQGRPYLIGILVVDCIVAVAAPFIDNWYVTSHTPPRPDIPLQAGAGLIAVVTFVGIWVIQRSRVNVEIVSEMRDAISAAVIVVYLVILSWSAFFPRISSSGGVLNPLTSTFITNFTALTGVVVGFYFTTTAATQIAAQRRSRASDNSAQQDKAA